MMRVTGSRIMVFQSAAWRYGSQAQAIQRRIVALESVPGGDLKVAELKLDLELAEEKRDAHQRIVDEYKEKEAAMKRRPWWRKLLGYDPEGE